MSDFPEAWPSTKLGDPALFSFESGIWTGKRPPFVERPVVRNTNFTNDGRFDFSNIAIVPVEERQLPRKLLRYGDIVIERSGGGPTQPVGRVAFYDLDGREMCFSNFTSRLRVISIEHIDPHFLHLYLLASHWSGMTELMQRRTTGIRNLDFNAYKDITVPLPPLREQRAIASVLRAVQAARDARRRELALERERKAALMEQLFTRGTRGEELKETEIGWMPRSWCCRKLGHLVDAVSGGTPSKQRADWWAGDIPWASPKDMKRPRLFDAQDHVTQEAALSSSRIVPAGAVFIVIRGMILAKDVPVALAMVPMAFNQDVKALIPHDSINGNYLLYVLRHRKHEIERLIGTSAHGTKRLGTDQLNDLLIPLPPIEEQIVVGDALVACDDMVTALENEIVLWDELFRALLEELMSGRLSTLPLVESAEMTGAALIPEGTV